LNRSIRSAALALLLCSAAPPAAARAAEDIPPPAPRAALPAEPKDAIRKKIQAAVAKWFENEPAIPIKGKTEVLAKAGRADASGEIETLVLEWNKSIPLNNCLRLVAWWKARLEETQPSENRPTGIRPKEEFTVFGKTWTFAVSVPNSYRGKGTDLLPVILTVIDKDADPKNVFKDSYGKLLDTHLVVASREPAVPNAGALLNGIYYAHLNYRIDRDRVTLDGIGKGARFVEELAAAEYACLQWNGVVIRNPSAVQPLEGNFGLFPVGVFEGATEKEKAAAEAHRAAGDPAKAHDPRKPFTIWFKSTGRMPKWGYWFTVDQAVDGGVDQPLRVSISRDPALNVVDLDATNLAEATLLLNDEVLDLDQPVHVRVNGIVVAKERLVRNVMNTFDWKSGWATYMLAPRSYFITAVQPFVVEGEARIPKVERDRASAAEKQAQDDAKKAEDDQKKADELDRLAKEAEKKAEEEAKNPKPVDPAVAAGPAWFASLADAKAAAGGKPVFIVFAGPADGALQKAVDLALASPDTKSALSGVACVSLPPDNEEGKALLATLSGAADTGRPYLAILNVQGTLSLAGLKEEEIAAKIAEFLKLLKPAEAPPKPAETPPPPPVAVEWTGDYEAGRKKAAASSVPVAVFFSGAADAKGQKELESILRDDPVVAALLKRLPCIRLDMTNPETAKAYDGALKLDNPSRTPPTLCLIKVVAAKNEKGEETLTNSIAWVGDPVNQDKAKLAGDLAAELKKYEPQAGTPK
jgi:hypothetical protein